MLVKFLKSQFTQPFIYFGLGLVVWLFCHWRILNGEYIFSHDSYYWFGIFKYFAEGFFSGFIPLWNPYSHAGEMFFHNYGMWMLIDPISISGIFLGKLFGAKNLFYLYELVIFARLFVTAIGIQLFLNHLFPTLKKYSYFIFFVVLLSSFSINVYHQNGAIFTFSYLPFILLFILKFFEKPNWFNTVFLGFFTGISFQSMHFAYISTFVILFTVLYLAFNRHLFKVIWNNKLKILICFAIFLALSSPSWTLIFSRDLIDPYARSIFNPEGFVEIFFNSLDHFEHSLAAFGKIRDFFSLGLLTAAKGLFVPGPLKLYSISIILYFIIISAFIYLMRKKKKYKKLSISGIAIATFILIGFSIVKFKYGAILPVFCSFLNIKKPASYTYVGGSEMSMFISFIPFVLGIIGIIFGKHKYKKLFLSLFIITVFLFIGPMKYNFVYAFLFYITPLLRAIENTHSFVNHFLLVYFYFVCLGALFLLEKYKTIPLKTRQVLIASLFIITLFELTIYNGYPYSGRNLANLFNKQKEGINGNKYFMLDTEFKLNEKRVYTALPNFKTDKPINFTKKDNAKYKISDVASRKDIFYIPNPVENTLNYKSSILKISTASDFYANFPRHKYLKLINPTTITYPIYYAKILKSDASEKFKSELMGVNLPIFQFYTNYKVYQDYAILDRNHEQSFKQYLSNSVILNKEPNIQISKNEIKRNMLVIDYNPDHIKLEIQTKNNALLLFRDGYDHNWIAKVDGKKQEVLRANYNSKAIGVPVGKHIVEFIYRPIYYILSLYLYFITTIAILIFFLYFLIKKILKKG